jgi:4-hydroxybenzoate polyprenyltransferase
MSSVVLNERGRGPEPSSQIPLCVDLDGTLIRTDLLIESALALIAQKPWMLFACAYWLFYGKARLKREIALRVTFDARALPYDAEVLEWVRREQPQRHTVLCTASDITLAQQVADHLGGFSEIIASDGAVNMSGGNKEKALVARFGNRGFDYIGNAAIDLKVWCSAHAALVVETGSKLSREAARVTEVQHVFRRSPGTSRQWIKALRVHQWVKNILVFLPLLASHKFFEPKSLMVSCLGFVCFSLCASSVYVTNDLLDLPADRQHPRKKNRPFAAGTLPLHYGPIAALALLVISFSLATLLPATFVALLAGYYVLTLSYSLRLKRVMMLDVIVLALLYTSRILGGTAALSTRASFWLLAFSTFIFLSLAMIKRYTELLAAQKADTLKAAGRGYDVGDIPLVQSLGGASGYLSVLVLAMYIDSTASQSLYRHPHYLWLLCPLLLYWISRTWAIAHRGIMHDDPVVFAIMDKVSRILLLLAAVIVIASI